MNNESGGGSIYAGSFDNANQDDNETLFLGNVESSDQRHVELERRVDGMQAEMGALNTRMGTISSHMDEGFGRLTALIQVAMGLPAASAATAPPARTDISPVVSISKSGEQELQTPFDAPRSAFKQTSPPRTPFAVQEDRDSASAAGVAGAGPEHSNIAVGAGIGPAPPSSTEDAVIGLVRTPREKRQPAAAMTARQDNSYIRHSASGTNTNTSARIRTRMRE